MFFGLLILLLRLLLAISKQHLLASVLDCDSVEAGTATVRKQGCLSDLEMCVWSGREIQAEVTQDDKKLLLETPSAEYLQEVQEEHIRSCRHKRYSATRLKAS